MQIFQSHPEAGLVYGDAQAIDADGKPFNLMRARPYSLADLMAFNIICQPAAFMRRSVVEDAGFLNPAYQLLMDNLLWMCMAQKAPIIYTPQTWAAARYHDQAKNRTRGAAYGQEAHRLIADLKSRPEFSELFRSDEKRIMAGVERFDGFYLTDAGRPGEALRSYGRAFRLYPKMAAQDWKHVLLAILSLLGLEKVRLWYDRLRTRRLHL